MTYVVYLLFSALLGGGFLFVIRRSLIRPAAFPVVLAVILVLTAACGEDPSREPVSSSADTTQQTDESRRTDTSAADTSLVIDTTFTPDGPARTETSDWSLAPVRVTPSVSAISVVAALRAAEHDGFDRFVVEFEGNEIPAYTIRYLDDRPIECGSGYPVELSSEAVLELHLEPSRGYTEEGTPTVDHSARSYGFEALKEGDVSCDFEAVFTVVLGVTRGLPFRVDKLSSPTRLVVDVRHTGA